VTSTIQSTVFSTIVTSDSNVATATSVVYVTSMTTTTINLSKRRAAEVEGPKTISSASLDFPHTTKSVAHKASDLGAPKVTIRSDKRLDVLAEKLERRGLVVERTVTATVTSTVYSTVTSVYTSTISSSHIFYVTSATTSFTTSTSFLKAQTTTTVTSTIFSKATVNGTASGGPGPPLSAGAKAGISIGTILGVAAIAAIMFFLFALWRRSRKENEPPLPSDGNQQVEMPTYYGVPNELAAAGAHHSSQASYSGAGVTPEPVSPTSSNMRSTGQWHSTENFQQPTAYLGYSAHTAPSGYVSRKPVEGQDIRAVSPQVDEGEYPQGVAEIGSTNMGPIQGPSPIEISAVRYNQAYEMPGSHQYRGMR
jgi:hypothetical protein